MSDLTPARDDFSLFQLESELRELMEFRDQEELTEEERQAVDTQIAAYVAKEIAKVDNLRAYMRHCQIMADGAKQEAELQAKRANSWKNRLEYLKGCCLDAMNLMGKKKLEGRTGYLLAKGNGGKQALTVYDDSLVPDSMCAFVGAIDGDVFKRLLDEEHWLLAYHNTDATVWCKGASFTRAPKQEAIRAALEKSCVGCGGAGDTCPTGPSDAPMDVCGQCHGTGKQIVPGARLEPRGSHVEIK